MTRMIEPMIAELQEEGVTTRRVLERVPGDKMAWRPHPTARPLGELALHVAGIPRAMANMAALGELDAAQVRPGSSTSPQSTEELLATFDESLKAAHEYLEGVSDEAAMVTWRMTAGPKEIFALPRINMLRKILFNHWYHHRGQLSVYLRMLEVPIPSIYGPSADDNPFA
jgi:uncharacterized damage-inducible protein DinB